MQQTITIEVPEGKELIQKKSIDGSIHIGFVNKKPIKSKSWKEFCENHPKCGGEFYISSSSSVIELNNGWNRNFADAANCLASREDAEGILALIQLTRLHDEWIKGIKFLPGEPRTCIFVPDDNNIPIVGWGKVYRFLSFSTTEMAEEFLDCFKDLIIKAKKFI